MIVELSTMREAPERLLSLRDDDLEECNSIAESMLEEIHSIKSAERNLDRSSNGRHKGKLKRLLMRQIRIARRDALRE
jgi:hypothetical protein